ncbi:bifunctional adenosylcobinamide kinase/adenosylcobinamide-phosphate guanylyltransferase [Chroococcus sp. FPU101]|uniref:bifunctional adenosylcobinamide kinase/adenosylcobinamide-phosphate guanylyltransferase n=1 Tax=Chroococcus sp. FPU101 TaxID=1974212 RepID=UPI001A904928|nr:bifunctional adenosylcobinamide kinase/adenosylcobinamide-phosphate guanylyltransferase [Chroococcus sp. FPU101]GFE71652.1 adenosylcobinamide kinase/adenosylcobinamide-phosphate guanylyltransferase [Chroococcus sp. FPU101]
MNLNQQIILITGPARSGKSEWAEFLAKKMNQPVTYVATAQRDPNDLEWQVRINQHQIRRPDDWKTVEVPFDLVSLLALTVSSDCLLIDSLGTWVANFLEQDELSWQTIQNDLLLTLQQISSKVIFVAEETGWGIVPSYASGRLFRDRLGTLTRKISIIAHSVYLVTGGYVLNLSELGQPLPSN